MKNTKVISMIILIVTALVIAYFYALPRLVFLGGEGSCNDELISEYSSPSGLVFAYHIINNCGATTDFLTQVTIGKDTAIRIKGYHVKDIEIEWKNEKELMVIYGGDESLVQLLNDNVNGVQVLFEDKTEKEGS